MKLGLPIGALLYLSLAEAGGLMLLIGVIGIQDRIVGPFCERVRSCIWAVSRMVSMPIKA